MDGVRTGPAAELEPGGRIGPWRVVRRLGRGGVATVYEVLDPGSGRRRALKLFHPHVASGASVRREYRALVRLGHRGIMRVFDLGETEAGVPFLVTELIVGRSSQASARAAGPPGSPARVALTSRVMGDLLDALAYLHRRGIVHRDIKSSNVLVPEAGGVRLLDLGTAGFGQHGAEDGGRWVPGLQQFAGTVVYSSPEQLRGETLDGRSDLFAVGVLWYRMLTGELPFVAAHREQAVLLRESSPPASPRSLCAGIPGEISNAVMDLLALDPDRRPGNAEELLGRQVVAPGEAPAPRISTCWPAPPPLVGRGEQLSALEGPVHRAAAGELALLRGPSGSGRAALLDWVASRARHDGLRVLRVGSPGRSARGLLARLLLAVPRHLRRRPRAGRPRATGSGGGGPGLPPQVQAALELLRRVAAGGRQRVLLVIDRLDACDADDLSALSSLRAELARQGWPVVLLASCAAGASPEQGSLEASRLVDLELLPPLQVLRFASSMLAGRALPFRLCGQLVERAGGSLGRAGELVLAAAEGARIRAALDEDGALCWLEEPVDDDQHPGLEPEVAALVARAPAAVVEGLLPDDRGLQELARPGQVSDLHRRAGLLVLRAQAFSRVGDRDVQAEADFLAAREALAAGGGPADTGRRLAAARARHLAARGRPGEAQRELADLEASLCPVWLRLAIARGEPRCSAAVPEAPPGGGLEWSVARAECLLQLGDLRGVDELLEPALEWRPSGWEAEEQARVRYVLAGSLRLQARFSEALSLLVQGLEQLDPLRLPLPRAILHLGCAHVELELFRLGMAREHLADAWALLASCDQPALEAERARLRGRLALACGDVQHAEARFRRSARLALGAGLRVRAALAGCQRAKALARLGRRREALGRVAAAEALLDKAGALPCRAVACRARWEAGGYREDPDSCYVPVRPWLEQQPALLPRLHWKLARLRYLALHGELARVKRQREEIAAILDRILSGLEPEDRSVLLLHPWARLRRG